MIAEPSVQSLYLVARSNGQDLGTGTGFVVEHAGRAHLVTNYHVAAGRDPATGQPRHASGAVTQELAVLHLLPATSGSIQWQARFEPVLDAAGDALWLEHPVHGRAVDVVALPLTQLTGIELHPYDLSGAGPVLAGGPATGVSVIGFPFGLTAGGAFGVWTRGFVASEPDVDFNELPLMLIDARTREGQSGSPVLVYVHGGMAAMADGSSAAFSGPVSNLLGVYSGRINSESDLGLVWKAQAVRDILAAQKRGRAGL